jgi:regulator of protease activity HflC (stomatin/prohibitin superfamily)
MMRKLAWIGALAAALAWTGVRAEDAQKKAADAQQDVNKAKAEAKEDVSNAQAEANKDVSKAQADAQKKVGEAEKDAQQKAADARSDAAKHDPTAKSHATFAGKDNFEMKGKIASVSSSSITVSRDDLPAAKLNLDPNTKVELDGDRVSTTALKPGQDVKASFNLLNDKPMAVEIKAKKSDHPAAPGKN